MLYPTELRARGGNSTGNRSAAPAMAPLTKSAAECGVSPERTSHMSLFDLTGKVALITGSSRGIGKAIAVEMARHGARVVISGRKAESCEVVAGEIRAAGGTAMAHACH